jgi:Tol biopolymer transport system component
MALAPGTLLGAYEVVALLRTGGMGEVYRARDPRLGREVAIKVLPAGVADDPDRLQRFEQEARAAAALNHPNILAVHDVGRHDGEPYIVSELLEGETLRERLHGGALPVRKAVEYAVQIAHGLAAAHEKGIVHRDLKPENFFVTSDGRIKILDFGLAKLTQTEPAVAGPSMLPTTSPGTLPGVVLGTMGYMAPEQLRGQKADHRADVFAFGAILYEMLSGQRAFRGPTTADTISAILDKDLPDLPAAERHIPPALVRIVDRCVEKAPAGRFQTASDLAFALEALSSASERSDVSASAATPARRSRERLAWVAAAGLFLALVAALALGAPEYFQRAPADTRVYRSTLPSPANVAFTDPIPARRFAVSPDGRRLAFTAAGPDGRSMLWVRPLDGLAAEPLAGTEDALAPFWSPDSVFIGFFTGTISLPTGYTGGGRLKRINGAGGTPVTLCEFSGTPGGASWNQRDVILFSTFATANGGLRRVSASGGMPSVVRTNEEAGEQREYLLPSFLPDGVHFLYWAASLVSRNSLGLYVASVDSTEERLLVPGGSVPAAAGLMSARYAQGYLLWQRDTTLVAQAFDLSRLELLGDALPVAEQVQPGAFTVSDTGVLAYQAGLEEVLSQLVWFDRSGKQIDMLGEPADYADLALSPDGTRAAVSIRDPARRARDIWLYDTARGLRTRFTFDPSDDLVSMWSLDGSRIVFNSTRTGRLDLYQKPSSGSGADELFLAEGNFGKFPYGWSPDGRFFLYASAAGTPGTGNDLYVLPLFGDRKPFVFLQTRFNEAWARFSPDGRWVAYRSDESGRGEVYVTSFPKPGGKWQISTGGGNIARWRRDGREIFYLAPDNKLMAAQVNGQGPGVEVGPVRMLFQTRAKTIDTRYAYDVSADGQRFLVITPVEQTTSAPLTLVVNWPALLKK